VKLSVQLGLQSSIAPGSGQEEVNLEVSNSRER
jgi:hypothetical protein